MERLSFIKIAWTVLAITAVFTGCDFLAPGGPSFSGIVVDAETGFPVEGIQMSLKIGGSSFGGSVTVAAVLTDESGQFWLRDPESNRSDRAGLYVNSPAYSGNQTNPFNSAYTSGLADYSFDNRHDIRIMLRRSLN